MTLPADSVVEDGCLRAQEASILYALEWSWWLEEGTGQRRTPGTVFFEESGGVFLLPPSPLFYGNWVGVGAPRVHEWAGGFNGWRIRNTSEKPCMEGDASYTSRVRRADEGPPLYQFRSFPLSRSPSHPHPDSHFASCDSPAGYEALAEPRWSSTHCSHSTNQKI